MVCVVSVVPEIVNEIDPEPLHRKDKCIGVGSGFATWHTTAAH